MPRSLALPSEATTLLPEGEWAVDEARSAVGFEVRHLKVARVRGGFSSFEGRISIAERPEITGSVAVASLRSGDEHRDHNLLGPAFLDAEAHPWMIYAGGDTVATPRGFDISGELTIKDVTRPLTLSVEPWARADGSIVLRARGRLSRRAYGLTWDAAGELAVADRVDLLLEIVLVRASL